MKVITFYHIFESLSSNILKSSFELCFMVSCRHV
jgi:hypothetical protein